jgi:DNA-binding LacI/PurR family transcriptional regulator
MSIVDVAKAAGVSHATVSRVLNGTAPVHAATARRVKRAMARLGYVAPPPERRRGRTARRPDPAGNRHLAVLCLDPDLAPHGGFLFSLFQGVRDAAERESIAVSLLARKGASPLPDVIRKRRVDGLLLVGVSPDPGIMREIRPMPHLWLTSHAGVDESAVLVGNEAVGRMAAGYLTGRGHRAVAYLSAQEENPSYRVRGEIFEVTARAAGADVSRFAARSPSAGGTTEALRQGLDALIRQMIRRRKRPTGVFCPSDCMTALAYGLLAEHGVRPGRDVEFVSCDHEEPYLAGLNPRPATIDLGCEERGRAAVEQLLLRIRHPETDRQAHLLIEPVLVASPAPPPHGFRGRTKIRSRL